MKCLASVLTLATLATGVFTACGPSAEPLWVHLASSGDPGDALRRPLTQPIAAAAWRPVAGSPGCFEARQPVLFIGLPPEAEPPYDLQAGERSFVFAADQDEVEGTFSVAGGIVRLVLGEDEAPPAASLTVQVAHDSRSGGRRAISGRRFVGEGLVVWPGERLEVEADVAAASTLRFATTVEAALTSKEARRSAQTFRVLLDDSPIFVHEQSAEIDSVEWHAVELPRGGGRGLAFTFEVEGPFAYTAFQAPIVGPADIGVPGDRPRDVRPDVVVFLADTFRADNLTVYGGDHGLTPVIDAFCEDALVARQAYSVSTHTLPAHSSMFSGVFPRQNGLVDYWNPLPDSIDTLAEVLARNGYRTAAVTDGIMVTQSHGMAQGFEWFDERGNDLDLTLERARGVLSADDGRPLFLFVQTYATHAPYRIRARTRARLQDRLDLSGDFNQLLYSLERATPDSAIVDLDQPGARATVAGLRQLYLGSVGDLDDAFGAFLDQLEQSGRADDGFVILTSDHGEAFCEHAELFHAGRTYQEQIRVPFIIRGPGLEPGTLEHPVSLIDLGPTVLDLARVPAPAGWLGSSVLTLDEARPLFAFQCRDTLGSSTLAVIDGPRKLIGYEDLEKLRAGSWIGAFDLGADGGENRNVFEVAPWAAPAAERFAPVLERLMVPLVESEELRLTAEEQERLRAMGYGGE